MASTRINIGDLTINSTKFIVEGNVVNIGMERYISTGKKNKIITLQDATGSITFTLWEEKMELITAPCYIRMTDCWKCVYYDGKLQISQGKFAKIEILGEPRVLQAVASPPAPEPKPRIQAGTILSKTDPVLKLLIQEAFSNLRVQLEAEFTELKKQQGNIQEMLVGISRDVIGIQQKTNANTTAVEKLAALYKQMHEERKI